MIWSVVVQDRLQNTWWQWQQLSNWSVGAIKFGEDEDGVPEMAMLFADWLSYFHHPVYCCLSIAKGAEISTSRPSNYYLLLHNLLALAG